MRSLVIRLGIIAAILIAAFVLRPFLTGNAGSLAAGDCIDLPTANESFEDVQHHPCTDPHGAEVILIADYEPSTEAFPIDAEFADFVADRCLPAFETYTGTTYESATDLSVAWFVPTEEAWKTGNRKVICYAMRTDQSTLAQSIKKA